MEKFIIYTDGGARGNPGPAGAGAVITDAIKRPRGTPSTKANVKRRTIDKARMANVDQIENPYRV